MKFEIALILHSCMLYILGEYFPKVSNDTFHVWEDESIEFDVLENDYFAGDHASIIEFSKVRASAE